MSLIRYILEGPITPERAGKRKRTKREAKKRLRDVPKIPVPPLLRRTPIGRGITIAQEGSRLGAELLIETDPLNRLGSEPPASNRATPVRRGISAGQIGERIAQGATLRQASMQRQQEARQMATDDTVREMINDPEIVLTVDDLPIINDPSIILDMNGELRRRQFERAELVQTKPKRKVSKYQKELGRQLKMLKKKHPRTPVTALMKRAHRATRKALSK